MRKNGKETDLDYNNAIKKSNSMVMSKLNQNLTLIQMQLFAYTIFATQHNKESKFNKADFEKKFNITKYHTSTAKKDVLKLLDLKISNESIDEEVFSYSNVFQTISYNNGEFSFIWTDTMLSHVIELQEKFVLTDLSITMHFKSSYSWVLYEFIKAHYGYWKKDIEKSTLYKLFGVEGVKTYNNTAQFKRGVLDVAIKELNEHTELDLKYEEIKDGRVINGFSFIWSTGNLSPVASVSQINTINGTLDIIFEDTLKYIDVDSRELRKRARELILESESIRLNLKNNENNEIKLKSSDANKMIKRVNLIFSELENIYSYAQQSATDEQSSTRTVPFYNWIEERE